jgi:creatinine amidohydrolase/Fe(II)-dependent formamide hydrolase-like protein
MNLRRTLAALALLLTLPASAQVLQLAELNTEQIRALDRARTVVLMPGSPLEEHGPYLPSFSDGYMDEWWTGRIAETIAARPGWTALVFPMLPLGHGGANEIGGKFVFPGSYGVRMATLRAVYMDLATALGEQGFRWIFVIQNHSSPLHNLALDQAADFFIDTYGGKMVNLPGLEPEDAPQPPRLSEESHRHSGIDIHAGLSESSRILFLKPQLVSPAIASAPSHAAMTGPELGAVAQKPGWPGYFSTPRLATAAYGAAMMHYRLGVYTRSALQILDGKDPRTFPRYGTMAVKRDKELVDAVLANDEKIRKKQAEWMRKKGID